VGRGGKKKSDRNGGSEKDFQGVSSIERQGIALETPVEVGITKRGSVSWGWKAAEIR